MSKLTFKYDIKKDAWSWVLIAKSKDIFGLDGRYELAHIPENLLSKIRKLSFLRAQTIVKNHLENHPRRKYRELMIKEEISGLSHVWKKVENNYFKILSEIIQKPIYTENFGCFFTTGFMCPYNPEENWFMVSVWHSLPFSITTICHELLHLQFLHYYKNYLKKKGLNSKQIGDLKEALTFLLNEPEFDGIILSEDKGYPMHKKLRVELKKIRDKEKDFKLFLDKAIEVIKNK